MEFAITDVGNTVSFKCRKTFKVPTKIGCNVKNLIYVMQCNGCGEECIWKTGDSLGHRMTVHRKLMRQTNVRVLHINSHIAN